MTPKELKQLNGTYSMSMDYGYDGSAVTTYRITHLADEEFALKEKTEFIKSGKFEKETTSDRKIHLISFDPETSIAEFSKGIRLDVKYKHILI